MLEENTDYYINADGNFVFTAMYHLKRGYCCKNKCLHCPWGFGKEDSILKDEEGRNSAEDEGKK